MKLMYYSFMIVVMLIADDAIEIQSTSQLPRMQSGRYDAACTVEIMAFASTKATVHEIVVDCNRRSVNMEP